MVTPTAFAASPLGCACTSGNILMWYPRADYRALAMWGRGARSDVAFLRASLEAVLRHEPAPHATLTDLRRVEGFDLPTLAEYVNALWSLADGIARAVLRAAVLYTPGTAGAQLLTYRELIQFPYPVAFFTDFDEALAWLSVPASPETHGAYELAVAQAVETSALLRRVRELLRDELAHGRTDATLDACARRLGVSGRSLQRCLQGHGTAFRDEARRARVEAAMGLLRDDGAKLSAVARAVGFEKLQNFNRAFRDETGLAPQAWRARQKSADVTGG